MHNQQKSKSIYNKKTTTVTGWVEPKQRGRQKKKCLELYKKAYKDFSEHLYEVLFHFDES